MTDVEPDPKPARRIKDPAALRVARLAGGECVACGGQPESVHHVIPKGERGDDVRENLLLLCGHGTARCHGAEHGSPYIGRTVAGDERRDAEWVHRRIGKHIAARRPDTIRYVLGKLGDDAGRAYLERRYYLVLPATSTPAAPSA